LEVKKNDQERGVGKKTVVGKNKDMVKKGIHGKMNDNDGKL